MTDDQGWRHADIDLLAGPLLLHHLLRLLGYRLQTVDEEFRDTWDELHHGTHRHTEEHDFLDVELCHGTDQGTDDDTQHDGFTEYAELLLQSLGVDVKF